MKLGFIGLGKMGSRMVFKLLQEGHEVVVWNRSQEGISNFQFQISNIKYKKENLIIAASIQDLVNKLDTPRIIWMMLSAGDATQNILDKVQKYIQKGDIVIDGGNANFKDTEKRYQELKKKGIRFLGIGVSGGIIAAEKGYPLMVGGDKNAYEYIEPILKSLAIPNGGYEYFGTGGAGHFVKMVHNGIEYGIMQSLGEGFGVLNSSKYKFDLKKVAKLYQKGTLVSGFLLDRAVSALSKDPKLSKIIGFINESGEAKWTVEEAKKEKVPFQIIEESLEFRRKSQKDTKIQKSFAARLVAALRNEFGGHQVKKTSK